MNEFEQTTLANINIVKSLTNTLGEGFKKSFGQNFLINQKSLLRFIDLLNIEKNDTVIEIGPGIGVVSYTLCQQAKKVYLIELDRSKETALKKVLENYSNYEIIWQDATNINWAEFIKGKALELEKVKFIGSLPYNVSKKIIYNIFTSRIKWNQAAFFLQLEVAQSYTSTPPQAEFLSQFARIFANAELKFQVPPEHFIPKPKVKTGVIHFSQKEKPSVEDPEALQKFIKIGFTQPRKTLYNNLKEQKVTLETIQSLGLKESVRPSEVSFDMWVKLFYKARELKKNCHSGKS